jgi:phage gp46-like protein
MKLCVLSDGFVDLAFGPGGIVAETGLASPALVSLLTDRRAGVEDPLPHGDTMSAGFIPPDRRGWAGDALSEDPSDRIGSRLWLLSREKQTESTRLRAIDYAREALSWMVADGHASRIEVAALWSSSGRLEMTVDIFTTNAGVERIFLPDAGGAYAL